MDASMDPQVDQEPVGPDSSVSLDTPVSLLPIDSIDPVSPIDLISVHHPVDSAVEPVDAVTVNPVELNSSSQDKEEEEVDDRPLNQRIVDKVGWVRVGFGLG